MSPLPERPDVDSLRHLAKIGLRARIAVKGLAAGIHKSSAFGWNVEFADFREYSKGDDIRFIDWKLFGRTDKFFIKLYEEETEMHVYILVDASRSMGYTTHDLTKLDYACSLASALSYLFIRQGDPVGLFTFDNKIRSFLPPRSTPQHLTRLWQALEVTQPEAQTDVEGNLRQLAARIKQRGLVILISDMFDASEDVLKGLVHFRHKKFEAIVFQVLDPGEIEFPFRGNTIFRDMESERWVETSSRAIREAYMESMKEFLDRVRKTCHQSRVDYQLMNTGEPLGTALLRYLVLRNRR